MTDQTFQGPVDQVAGRDINNILTSNSKPLIECSREELEEELNFCNRRLETLRYELLVNWATIGMALLMLALVLTVVKGYLPSLLTSGNSEIFIIGAIWLAICTLGISLKQQKYGPAIGWLKAHIGAVKAILLIKH